MEIFQIVLYITLFCLLLLIYKRSNSEKKPQKSLPLPPGPWKLPLIGNVHQIVGALPHHAFRKLSDKYGPLMHLQLGETSNVIVSSSEIAKEIFKTHDLIMSNRPDILAAQIITYNNIDIGFSPHGSHWRNLRKICTLELLTAKRVRSFRFIREEEVSVLVKDVLSASGSVINLSEKIFSTITSIVARAAFGRKSGNGDQEAFLSTLDDVTKMVGGFSIVDLFPSIEVLQRITGMKARLERVHKLNDQVLENIIRSHKERKASGDENNEENLVDVLLKIQEGKDDQEFRLTHDHVKAVILDMFIAGSETSSTTLEWAMAELMKNPQVMEKAQVEIRMFYKGKDFVDESEIHQLKYLNSIVKETLRLHPPGVLLLPRESTERCVINGYEIPKKTRIMVNGWAIGRDPKYWDEAETFKPERFLDNPIDFRGANMDYIPFGAGRRICPGINFAISSIELPLANLLYHFDWKLPNGMTPEKFDMSETFAASVRRTENLQLIPISHQR
ncbi:cytochrome P450 71D10-like [Prosopis cineraria]|uniref:cytochrome P450 71D10-like n=1 Tax=Prosopis cineraria TaxID=364024 RepID=UPI00240FB2AF|nr:cytochrome P450 71D10-like [Prosopis cineraria]